VNSLGIFSRGASPLLAASMIFCGLALAGCDEQVQVIQDTDIHVMKHQTWAWRPMQARRDSVDGGRPVISRDVIRPNTSVPVESDPAVEIERRQSQSELERQLAAKGLVKVSDPAAANYLVDYQFAVHGRNVTVPRAYPGSYPGLVCGPYGCWNGWGYGPVAVGYQNVNVREGTFAFDMVQNGSKRLVYQATGQAPANKAQFSHDQIQDMVHALLNKLKVKK
jgi:hypothetical protein